MSSNTKKDYYEILKVAKTATQEELKAAYRKLAIKLHPDRNPNKSEEEKKELSKQFQEVNAAYHVLSDPEKRKKYDMFGHAENFDHGGFDINDILRDVFAGGFNSDSFGGKFGGNFGSQFSGFQSNFGGFGGGFNGSNKCGSQHFNKRSAEVSSIKKIKPTEHRLPCSIEDFYNGTKKKLKITRNTSRGSEEEVIIVPILSGYKKNTKINYKDKGDEIAQNVYNDVVVVLDEKVEDVKREGNDLIYEIKVTMKEYFMNKKVTLSVVGNRSFSFFVGEVGPGCLRVFSGCGMPNRKEGGKGDLKVRVVVEKDDYLYKNIQAMCD